MIQYISILFSDEMYYTFAITRPVTAFLATRENAHVRLYILVFKTKILNLKRSRD